MPLRLGSVAYTVYTYTSELLSHLGLNQQGEKPDSHTFHMYCNELISVDNEQFEQDDGNMQGHDK